SGCGSACPHDQAPGGESVSDLAAAGPASRRHHQSCRLSRQPMIGSAYSVADLVALWISLKLATVTMVLLLLACTPLAWWLATTRSKVRVIFEAVVALPLVLPPTVVGFYLLL